MNYYDFNTAETNNFDLIPRGTIAKLNIKIKLGGYNDESRGFSDDYATLNQVTGAMYLSCEYTIMSGKYKGRKIWSLIGLYSNRNNNRWGDIGRSLIRGILNSRAGISDKDTSEDAVRARQISSFSELDGSEFVAKIDIERDKEGNEKNVIKTPITPAHRDYAAVMFGDTSYDGTISGSYAANSTGATTGNGRGDYVGF